MTANYQDLDQEMIGLINQTLEQTPPVKSSSSSRTRSTPVPNNRVRRSPSTSTAQETHPLSISAYNELREIVSRVRQGDLVEGVRSATRILRKGGVYTITDVTTTDSDQHGIREVVTLRDENDGVCNIFSVKGLKAYYSPDGTTFTQERLFLLRSLRLRYNGLVEGLGHSFESIMPSSPGDMVMSGTHLRASI